MGSSMVMMWPRRVRLTRSITEASVVDLPEPVGPVTSTSQRRRSAKDSTTGGIPRSASGVIRHGMRRMTAPTASRCQKTLTRKRASPGTAWAKSSSRVSSSTWRCRSVMIA